MIVRVVVNLLHKDMQRIEKEAVALGYKRIDPQKVWTEKEQKELVRWYVHKLLKKV